MVFRASEYGESKVGRFLDFPHWSETLAAGGAGRGMVRPATSPATSRAGSGDNRAHTRMPPPQVHGRKKGGGCCFVFPFHVFTGPEEHEMEWEASRVLPILSNFPRGHLLKRRLGTFLLSVYRTAFNCPAFQKYFSNS